MIDRPEYLNAGLNLPILQEEVDVQKHAKVTGVVRLEKTVRTVEAAVDEDLVSTSISVEHVPMNKYVDEV
jgi:stress response protein YsnF